MDKEPNYEYFELHRQIDDLIYQFDRRVLPNGDIGYKRRDLDLWITYRGKELGWVAFDDESKEVRGRPWNIKPENQIDTHPPEGEWVSKKGVKSYVYLLTYKDVRSI